jgi:hypothetical protein
VVPQQVAASEHSVAVEEQPPALVSAQVTTAAQVEQQQAVALVAAAQVTTAAQVEQQQAVQPAHK